mmetsp:Transcript_97911/g.168808  ORF Transcript_97911/g.168808 Transcript_97911/m.168808 type:complete len:94 (+) Transcript_97911:316-597(+)
MQSQEQERLCVMYLKGPDPSRPTHISNVIHVSCRAATIDLHSCVVCLHDVWPNHIQTQMHRPPRVLTKPSLGGTGDWTHTWTIDPPTSEETLS